MVPVQPVANGCIVLLHGSPRQRDGGGRVNYAGCIGP